MLPFSPGPVPTTDVELATRLRAGLLQLLRPRAAERVVVSATDATAEYIGAVSIDLSGAEAEPVAGEVPAAGGTPVTVDRVSLVADPLTVRGVRGQVRGALHRVPAAWVTDGAGVLWLLPREAGQPATTVEAAE